MKTMLRGILVLSLAGTPLLARQEPDEKPKPEEPKKKQEGPDQPRAKEEPKRDPRQEPAPAPKQQKEEGKKQKEQAKENSKQQRKTADQDNQARASRQRPSEKGTKIPSEKFRSSFGREHHFRVARRDDRRFQYSGYWFEIVEAWPVGWSYDDDCYIAEDGDDYYLVDVVHPEMRVLVVVVAG